VVGRPIGHQHIRSQQEGRRAGCEPANQQQATEKLRSGDEASAERRKRDPETHKESCDLGDIVHLTPTRLRELPAPVRPDRQSRTISASECSASE
jgi:hypothetical protein